MTDAQAEPSQEPMGLAERVQVLEALVARPKVTPRAWRSSKATMPLKKRTSLA